MGPGGKSFMERRQRERNEATGDRLVVSCPSLSPTQPSPPPSIPHPSPTWPPSRRSDSAGAGAATGSAASRPAVPLLKARDVSTSQLWGDGALPLTGRHVGPVTQADVVALYPVQGDTRVVGGW